ncbi:MAG TPA: zf-HC2 domain-containing protein [Actinomycetota bacterium]|jgi:hypothetical protein
MTCLQARDQLAEFVMDTLPVVGHREVERHLQTCAGCRKEVSELQEGLAGAAIALPIVEPPPSLEDRVVTKVQEASGRWRSHRRRAVRVLAVSALAAAVLAAGSVTWGLAMRAKVQTLQSREAVNATKLISVSQIIKQLRANGKALTATLVPAKGYPAGGGTVVIVTAPNEPDTFMIQVLMPETARGPFSVLLQERSGRTLMAGKLTRATSGAYMLASGGGFRVFAENLAPVTTVLVLDAAGHPVLTGDVRPYSST